MKNDAYRRYTISLKRLEDQDLVPILDKERNVSGLVRMALRKYLRVRDQEDPTLPAHPEPLAQALSFEPHPEEEPDLSAAVAALGDLGRAHPVYEGS